MIKLIDYTKKSYALFSLSLRTCEERNKNIFSIVLFRHGWYFSIPNIIKPKLVWVDTTHLDWAKKEGFVGYHQKINKEYGITITEEAFFFRYGADTMSSETTKSFCWIYPWKSPRLIRRDFFTGLNEYYGSATIPDKLLESNWIALRTNVPKTVIKFKDYDGEENIAFCFIEETEYAVGRGKWKWLTYFLKNKVFRTLEIEFLKEVGREKGSWKGGTLGHSIDIKKEEDALDAFNRYALNYFFTDVEVLYYDQVTDRDRYGKIA